MKTLNFQGVPEYPLSKGRTKYTDNVSTTVKRMGVFNDTRYSFMINKGGVGVYE